MPKRILFSLLLVVGILSCARAQSSPTTCQPLAEQEVTILDEALSLNEKQANCLREVSQRFCAATRSRPPTNQAQANLRLRYFRSALLACLSTEQQDQAISSFRTPAERAAGQDLLWVFMQQFGAS